MDTAATLFARQLAEAGITAEVRLNPPDTYFTTVWAKQHFYDPITVHLALQAAGVVKHLTGVERESRYAHPGRPLAA